MLRIWIFPKRCNFKGKDQPKEKVDKYSGAIGKKIKLKERKKKSKKK